MLSTLTNLQRRRCPVSKQKNLVRREIWQTFLTLFSICKPRFEGISKFTGGPGSSCEIIILHNRRRGQNRRVWLEIFTTALRGLTGESLKEIGEIECVTPALFSRRQTLKFFRHSHATRVNERGELDSKGTMEQRNLRSQCQKYRKQKDYCYGDSLVTSSYKGPGTLGKFLLIFKMKTSVIGSVRQLRLVIFSYQILSTLTNLQRRRCPVSNQENLVRREIWQTFLTLFWCCVLVK